jgi:branched-chain amino acid transport system permease protein
MKKSEVRQSLNTGAVFGIIHIFCVLIGFNAMMGSLLVKIVGQKSDLSAPTVASLVAYAILLGLFAGIVSARRQHEASLAKRVLASLLTGVVLSILATALVGIFQLLLTNHINPRNTFPTLSFPFMKACLFKLAGKGVWINFFIFLGSTVLGGLLNGLWDLPTVTSSRKNANTWIKNLGEKISGGSPKVKKIKKYAFLGLAILIVAIVPVEWGSYWNYVIGTVGLYVILGLGLNIIVGLSGQLVLGFIAFFAIGAYTVALLNAPIPFNIMLGFWPSLILAIILAAFTGLLLGLPIMNLRGDYLAIVTLGFGEIIRILLKSDVLTPFTGGPRGVQDIHGPMIFGHEFNDVNYMYLIIFAVILAIFVYNRLQNSRSGRAWMAIREDETVAKATGVNTGKYKLLALMIGAAFAGLAGAIYAARNQYTGPDEHAMMASINVLCLIIVGGMGNIPGTLLGAFALKGLPELLREVENYRMLVFGALLVAMMLIRPEGLIPSKRPIRDLPDLPDENQSQEPTGAAVKAPGEQAHDR